MGKWKYINWAITVIILFFMYGTLSKRYNAGWETYLIVTAGWLMILGSGIYVFVLKIKHKRKNYPISHYTQASTKPKPRPKVVLNQRNKNDQN